MNRIVEFYEANYLLVLLIVLIVFGIYILSLKKRNRNSVTMNSLNEDKEDKKEIFDRKIETWSIVKLKYILTGEVVTCDFAKNTSKKYKKPSQNIKRIYFEMPLAVALFDKQMGDIIKYKDNELNENYIYVEVLDINNSLSTDEERAMYGNNDTKLNEDNELGKAGMSIIKGEICYSIEELINLLKIWLEKTDEMTIGDIDNFPKYTKWIFLNLNGNNYYMNADTNREGIKVFLKNHENNNPWKVIANTRNVYKKISNDINGKPIKYFYFYSETEGQREI